MAPLTRRRKAALDAAAPAIDPADRLSELPHEILAHILSFLPAQDAVQTCILGRTWRDVWKMATRLLLTGDYVHEVREFVEGLLRVRLDDGLKHAPLDACEIVFHWTDGDEDDVSYNRDLVDTNSWVRRVLKCHVQTLRVDTYGYIPGEVNMELSSRPLVSRHLTRLELEGVEFEGGRLNLEGCPALEHLEMRYCWLPGVVTSPSLKRLGIRECGVASCHMVQIHVPSLVSLWLQVGEVDQWIPQLESMPDLVRAHVDIVSFTDLFDSDDAMCKLLQGLAEAKVLEMVVDSLSTSVLNATFQRDLRPCPIFSKLKTLVLKFCVKYKAEVKSTMTSQHLKIVEVQCESVDQRVLKLLKFFWYT